MIVINNIGFWTEAALYNYIRIITNNIGICTSLKEKDMNHYNFFLSLFKKLYNYDTDNVIDIFIDQDEKVTQFDVCAIKEGDKLEKLLWVESTNTPIKNEDHEIIPILPKK